MYYKKVDYKNRKACFNFLANHFTYPTLNSWNGLKSIANNVKVYNLPIDSNDALKALEEDNYFSINCAIEDWNADHPGYTVGFNGRLCGYLVLYSSNHNGHCFKGEESPCFYDSYEDWKEEVQEHYLTLKNFDSILINEVKIVQEFDQLCDQLIEITKALIAYIHKREALTKPYNATLRFQRYYYDTVEDLKLHMLDMKRRGYSVWEYSDTELYAEYEMNEAIHSEIILDEEGDEDFVYA